MIYSLENSLSELIDYKYKKILLPEDENYLNLHTTILNHHINHLTPRITEYLKQIPFNKIEQALLRVYLLKDKKILREYDFFLEKSLKRFEAKNSFIFKETIKKFKEKTKLKPTKKGFKKIKSKN